MNELAKRRLSIWLTCAVIGALVFCVAGTAEAQVVPYKSFGTGVYDPASGDYGGSGKATHLGNHNFAGNLVVQPTDDPLVLEWQSTHHVNFAANGDEIWFDASGEVTLIPLPDGTFTAIWEADFIPVGGTGRFANIQQADEPLKVIAINDPFSFSDPAWTFSWELTGEIDLGRKP